MIKNDTAITKYIILRLSKCQSKYSKRAVNIMSSVKGRTALMGTAIAVMNYGFVLMMQDSPMEGGFLFALGVVVMFLRELLFDVEYNGSGNIVDAMMDSGEGDEENE